MAVEVIIDLLFGVISTVLTIVMIAQVRYYARIATYGSPTYRVLLFSLMFRFRQIDP